MPRETFDIVLRFIEDGGRQGTAQPRKGRTTPDPRAPDAGPAHVAAASPQARPARSRSAASEAAEYARIEREWYNERRRMYEALFGKDSPHYQARSQIEARQAAQQKLYEGLFGVGGRQSRGEWEVTRAQLGAPTHSIGAEARAAAQARAERQAMYEGLFGKGGEQDQRAQAAREASKQAYQEARAAAREMEKAENARARAQSRSVGHLHEQDRLLGRMVTKVSRIARYMLAAFGVGTFTWILNHAMRGLAELQVKFEQQRLALGTMLQNAGFTNNWKDSYGFAGAMRDRMRTMAAERPGSLDDWMEASRDILAISRGTGATSGEVLSMTENAVFAGLVSGLKRGTVGFDIRQLMMGQGNARMIQTPFLRDDAAVIAALARGDAAWLRKKGRDDLAAVAPTDGKRRAFQMISDRLQAPPEAREEYGKKFESQLEGFKDLVQRFFHVLGTPVFDRVTQKLREWNVWLQQNWKTVQKIAWEIGTKLVRVVERAYETVAWIARNWDLVGGAIREVVKTIAAAKLLGVFTRLKNAVAGPGGIDTAFRRVGSAAVAGAATAQSAWLRALGSIKAAARGLISAMGPLLKFMVTGDLLNMGLNTIGMFTEKTWGGMADRIEGNTLLGLPVGRWVNDLGAAVGIGHSVDQMRKWADAETERALSKFNGGDDQKYYDEMLARMAAESAKNGATVNVDQRGSHFEVKQDLRGEDPDAVFLNMQKGVAREALAFVASPYTPA